MTARRCRQAPIERIPKHPRRPAALALTRCRAPMLNTLEFVVLLLAAAVVMVAFFRSMNLPPVLAYLLVGALGGPHALGT